MASPRKILQHTFVRLGIFIINKNFRPTFYEHLYQQDEAELHYFAIAPSVLFLLQFYLFAVKLISSDKPIPNLTKNIMIKTTPNFHFNGKCEQAIRLYEQAFNAKVERLLRYSDARPDDYDRKNYARTKEFRLSCGNLYRRSKNYVG